MGAADESSYAYKHTYLCVQVSMNICKSMYFEHSTQMHAWHAYVL